MSNLIKIDNLCKSFDKKNVLDNISLEITKGKIIGLLGENGAGKTTLIKILAGIYKKNSGTVNILDIPVGFDTHKYISYMPDENFLHPWMKVKDAINYYTDLFPDFDIETSIKLCKELKLEPNNLIEKLSTGTKERVMIMLTFSRKAPIYLLDEPIGGIDPVAKDMILKTVISNVSEDSTVLLSTHLLKDIETILDEVIFIKDGKILTHKTCDSIRETENKSIEEYYLEVMKNA